MNGGTSAFPSPNSQSSDALNSQGQLSTMISGMHAKKKIDFYLFIQDFLYKEIIYFIFARAILKKS